MKNSRLIIVAPNDRYNYGDLLFSHIIKHNLQKHYDEIVNVSTIDNDLSNVGGDKVKKIEFLYNLNQIDFTNDIIIAGGESFCSKWRVCLSYISQFFNKILKLIRKILVGVLQMTETYNFVADYIAKKIIGGKTFFPYTIGKNEIKNVRYIFYNSLGGSFIKQSQFPKRVINILKSVDYLSVRDRSTHELLLSNKITNSLFPDCAVQMSDLFPVEYLVEKVSKENKDFVSSQKNGYVTFQINKRLGLLNYSEIILTIKKIYKQHHKKVYLCPVGFALGHEDNIILEKIYEELKSEDIVFYKSQNTIWDIMYVIASSSLYIGTSLHGAITAMSFNVPYLGIFVNKTIQYIKEWGLKNSPTTSTDLNVMDKIEALLNTNLVFYSTNSKQQKLLVTQSFNNMLQIVNK